MSQSTSTGSAKPRTVLSVNDLAQLDGEAQSKYCTNIVGNDVTEEEVDGLLYLAENGKGPHTQMWAVFALGRAGDHYLQVVPKLSELLERPENPGRFRGNLAEAIGKLPGAIWHFGLLFRNYADTKLETEYRGVVGCAIVRICSNPDVKLAADSAAHFIDEPIGEESPACAVLRHMIEKPVHDSIVEAALKAIINHPRKDFIAARAAIEAAAGCRHSDSIKAAGKAALASC